MKYHNATDNLDFKKFCNYINFIYITVQRITEIMRNYCFIVEKLAKDMYVHLSTTNNPITILQIVMHNTICQVISYFA